MWTDLPRFRLHACPVRKSFPLLLYHDKLHQDQLNAAPSQSCSTIAQRCNARTARKVHIAYTLSSSSLTRPPPISTPLSPPGRPTILSIPPNCHPYSSIAPPA